MSIHLIPYFSLLGATKYSFFLQILYLKFGTSFGFCYIYNEWASKVDNLWSFLSADVRIIIMQTCMLYKT